jgi:SAM-dependent methyltransferase
VDAPLSGRHPTTRFTDRADDYARHRPSYPAEAIDAVLEGLGEPASLAAADVGAGTGISARLLADRGVRVVAVEPNGAMRAAALAHPRVTWRDGRAEATGLPGASVDLVLCAQAFHWFEPEPTLREFRRILRPGGRLALVWNQRDEDDPLTAEYGRRIREVSDDTEAASDRRRSEAPAAVAASGLFLPLPTAHARYEQALDEDGLVGRARSASYVPKDGPAWTRLESGLRALHRRHRDAKGLVSLRYRTDVYRCARAGS